ncbi:MAG: DUF1232 domain-containing protein [Myxococcales bacterium]|nr:DUF1232 domain-containing protein [Myxococcales bacterium]
MNVTQARSVSSRVVDYLRDPLVPLWRKLTALAAAAYLVLPVDAVPDVLPVLGWLDDLGVLSAATWFMVREIRRHVPSQMRTMPPGRLPLAR